MAKELDVSIKEILEIAFSLKLHEKETPNHSRRWTPEEELFLKNHAKELTIRNASNLLYRSYYATYMRVRLLGLEKIIKKSKGK